MKNNATFASSVLHFQSKLNLADKLPVGVKAMNPFREGQVLALSDVFLRKFYDDKHDRVLVLGINPGRFGSGLTGVAFTDPFALQEFCGIPNKLSKTRESSATFIYQMIAAYGGVREFCDDFYLGATCPLGFLKDGVNYNFYDDPQLQNVVTPFIVNSVRKHVAFGGINEIAIVLGSGKLKKFWKKLNAEHKLFKSIVYLEHPRYIMQYKRRELSRFIVKYKKALLESREYLHNGRR